MRAKHILLASTALVLLLAVFGLLGIARRGYHRPPPFPVRLHMPHALASPSVVLGDALLSKKLLAQEAGIGSVTRISVGKLHPGRGSQIGVAGVLGAVVLSRGGRRLSTVHFPAGIRDVDIVDVDSDGTCEYLNRGGCTSTAALMDHSGRVLWSYTSPDAIDDVGCGDINGDGLLEFVVGFNGDAGIQMLNSRGRSIWWQRDCGNAWHVEIADANGDGRPEILHSSGQDLMVRDRRGTVLSSNSPDAFVAFFSLVRWPSRSGKQYVLVSNPDPIRILGTPVLEKDTLWLLNLDGTTVRKLDAPLSSFGGSAVGVPVRLRRGQPDYLAVLVNLRHWNRAVLYVYDPDGALAYQEVLGEPSSGLAPLPTGRGGKEAVLVGGVDKVWQYRLR